MPAAPPPGSLFDVYIVGGEGLEAVAQLKVAALLASRYRLAAAAVAEGLAGGWCLVGKRMVEPEAKRLAEELADLGARTEALPAGSPLPVTRPGPASAKSSTSAKASTRTSAKASMSAGARRADGSADAPAAEKRSDVVRCPTHGLSYDRARSSGCLRCMQPARELARSLEQGRRWPFWSAILRSPVKRAFAALALALAIGFLPAAYYSFGISGAEVRRIRARQLELSAQPGTTAITDEFDRLEAAVAGVRRRGMVHTAILWVLVSSIAGAGLFRFAARGQPSNPVDG